MTAAAEPENRLTIGVDIGGTNFRAALYRGLGQLAAQRAAHAQSPAARGEAAIHSIQLVPKPVRERREPLGDTRHPEAVVDRLIAAIAELSGDEPAPIPVGIGFAGMLSGHEGFVTRSPHLGWHDVHLGKLL
ncbi:MAG TPA: hypothetical protein VFG83_18740, partial [Kofleriaceae bacterium]|nr:hypothetical protein [Kofleriaceae bacterium]